MVGLGETAAVGTFGGRDRRVFSRTIDNTGALRALHEGPALPPKSGAGKVAISGRRIAVSVDTLDAGGAPSAVTVFQSPDGGATWTKSKIPDALELGSLAIDASGKIYATVGSANGVRLVERTGPAGWESAPENGLAGDDSLAVASTLESLVWLRSAGNHFSRTP
jgi:hypothetical protein